MPFHDLQAFRKSKQAKPMSLLFPCAPFQEFYIESYIAFQASQPPCRIPPVFDKPPPTEKASLSILHFHPRISYIWENVPFPENPFENRMDMEELDEYLETLFALKEKYKNQIEVKIGFEVEYLPKYFDFYKSLQITY